MTEINPTSETPSPMGFQLDIVSLLNDENFLASITQWQEAHEDSLEFDPETLPSIMTDYVSAVIKSINLCLRHQIDTLVFLDKSARPISHTFNYLWDKISNSHVLVSLPPKPKIRFRNIGRETNPDLNRQFTPAEIKAFGHGFQDSKNLLIIDDTMDTGRTIADTDKLMQVALPNATITYTTLETVIWDPNDHSRFKQRYTGVNDFQLKKATKKTFPYVPKNQLTPDQHTQAQEKYLQGFSSIGVGDLHDQKHLFRRDLDPLLDTVIKYLSPTPLNTLTLPTINPQTRNKLYKNNPNQFR